MKLVVTGTYILILPYGLTKLLLELLHNPLYGVEEILPIEVKLPSLRISLKEFVSKEDYRVASLT